MTRYYRVARTDRSTGRADVVNVGGDSEEEVRDYYDKAGYHVHSVKDTTDREFRGGAR